MFKHQTFIHNANKKENLEVVKFSLLIKYIKNRYMSIPGVLIARKALRGLVIGRLLYSMFPGLTPSSEHLHYEETSAIDSGFIALLRSQ